jgi:N-acetyl-gamma-glutamyl-phosphate reductase
LIGATGYSGLEFATLLRRHSAIQIAARFASSEGHGVEQFDLKKLKAVQPSAVVLATDHDVSMELVPQLLDEGCRVIDMSGAFRLPDAALYPKWYGFEHPAPSLLKEAVYGLTEFFSAQIQAARLVANPGCYATAAILPLRPLFLAGVIHPASVVVIDGKSGVTGAGKKAKPETHFCAVNENIRAYGALRHRHTPEIVTYMGDGASTDRVVFTPHVIPISRGILNTIVIRHPVGTWVRPILADAFASSSFVKVLPEGELPDIHSVTGTNFCHIGVVSAGETSVLVSAIDNLGKGAAGQALQNLNLMLGCDSMDGLTS